jgi:hypothetical protein
MRFPVKKTSFSRHGGKLKPSTLQPVLPLLPEVLPTKDQDKSKFINFELKSRAGQPAGSTTYKKFVRVFEEGSPQQWIDLIRDLEEIWTQNSVNGPSDRTSTIRTLLKGESLTAFETALEDVRVDPDPSTRKTAVAITKINNCLPIFPLGSPASKFADQEVVGLLKGSLPSTWRKKFDLDGYVPTLRTKAKLILECEAIEQNESVDKKERKDDDHNNNNYKKNKFGNSAARAQKNERGGNSQFYCKNCGLNHTHVTAKCYVLNNKTWQTQCSDKKNLTMDKEASKKNRPFLRCTFRKEVNTLARKAGKKRVLGLKIPFL